MKSKPFDCNPGGLSHLYNGRNKVYQHELIGKRGESQSTREPASVIRGNYHSPEQVAKRQGKAQVGGADAGKVVSQKPLSPVESRE